MKIELRVNTDEKFPFVSVGVTVILLFRMISDDHFSF